MSLPSNKTGFNFNHADQVDNYGEVAGDSSIIKTNL